MHENEASARTTQFPTPRTLMRFVPLVFMVMVGSARAEQQPSTAMMQPVKALVAFMSTLPLNAHPDMFAQNDPCVVENFAPYVFCGPNAARRWEVGFRSHSREEALSRLSARFAAAHDFDRAGDRVYFSLPTIWTGLTAGRPFVEHGAWAFVLVKESGGWRVKGYGWGVYAYQEQPASHAPRR